MTSVQGSDPDIQFTADWRRWGRSHLLSPLARWSGRALNAGITYTDDANLERKIRLLNSVALLVAIYTPFMIGYLAWLRTDTLPRGAIIAILMLVGCVVTLVLNRWGHLRLARVFFLLVGNLALLLSVLFDQGTLLLTHFLFIGAGMLAVLLHKLSEWRASLPLVLLSSGLFVFFHFAGWPASEEFVTLTPTELSRAQESKGTIYIFFYLLLMGVSEFAVTGLARRLDEMGHTDLLTGLPNRLALKEALDERLLEAGRRGTVFGVAHIDLDHFKLVNDAHGHAVGDEALKWVAGCLQRQVRTGDFVARTGGEEFMMLLTAPNIDAALVSAERLRTEISTTPCPTSAGPLRITLSVGLAMWHPQLPIARVLREADLALYRAKQSGRDRVCIANLVVAQASRVPVRVT